MNNSMKIITDDLSKKCREAWDLSCRIERGVSKIEEERYLSVLLSQINDTLPTVIDAALGRK